MTLQEQLAALRATREEKQKRLLEIAQKSTDEQRSMNTAEAEEFDTAETEIKTLDADIGRLSRLVEIQKATAAVVEQPDPDGYVEKAQRGSDLQLKKCEKLEPGIAFARYAMCLTKAKGKHDLAFQLAQRHFPNTEPVVRLLKAQAEGFDLQDALKIKAAVAAGTTTDGTWAAPLVDAQNFAGDFIEYLRPRTLVGQAQFRPVPFNVRIAGQTTGGTAGWVGEGKAKPVTKFGYNAVTVPFTKVAAIAVLTQELVRFSDPSAEALVRDSLADTVIERIDADLFDPDLAAVPGVSPAGLLYGVTPVAVAGNSINFEDPASVRCAIAALWAPWDSTHLGARPAYYTTPAVARMLAFARDPLGNVAFPGVTPTGGTLDGIPLRVSQYLANNGGSGGAPFILVDESEVYLADDGSVTLDSTDVAAIQMDNDPGSNSGTPTAAQLVSMWQTNSVAFRAERFIWWGLRRSGAVQWIDGFPTTC